MSNLQQHSELFRIDYINQQDPDNLMEWFTNAPDRRSALLYFLYIHENPELVVVSCKSIMVNEKIEATSIDHEAVVDFLKSTVKSLSEEEVIELPEYIQVQDDFLVRAVYALCHLWAHEEGEVIFRTMANSLHLIGAHSLRYTLQGEPLSPLGPTNNSEAYTYLRDAAFLLDFIANGDNAVFMSSQLVKTVTPLFSDLTEN